MERDTSSLYTTLELSKSATPEEIKKVFLEFQETNLEIVN
jgi:DnaJ-class molecular chaperone